MSRRTYIPFHKIISVIAAILILVQSGAGIIMAKPLPSTAPTGEGRLPAWANDPNYAVSSRYGDVTNAAPQLKNGSLADQFQQVSQQFPSQDKTASPTMQHKVYLPLIAKPAPFAAMVVEPGIGGVLTSADGTAAITFPPNAVDEPTQIVVQQLPAPVQNRSMVILSPILSLSAHRVSNGEPVTYFQEFITVTLASNVARAATDGETSANIHYYDEEKEQWFARPTSRDPENSSASIQIWRPTDFALMAVADAEIPRSFLLVPHIAAEPSGDTFPYVYRVIYHNAGNGKQFGHNDFEYVTMSSTPDGNGTFCVNDAYHFEVTRPDGTITTRTKEHGRNEPPWVKCEEPVDISEMFHSGMHDLKVELADLFPVERGSDSIFLVVTAEEIAREKHAFEYGVSPWTYLDGDPVNMATGNFVHQTLDLNVPAPGFDFTVARTYNSRDDADGPFGIGWSSSLLGVNLWPRWDGTVDLRWGDGQRVVFTNTVGTAYQAQPGVYDDLVRNPDDSFTLTRLNQTEYHFSADGNLQEIVDTNGNVMAFTYSGGQLTAVTDPVNRTYTFTYNSNHIETITDPLGRVLTYAYSGDLLTAFTDANGNNYQYDYDGQGRLITFTDPEGIVYLQNIYDDDGRSIEQLDGSGVHSYFAYAPNETTFTDNLGNQTIYRYDDNYRVTERIDAHGNSVQYEYDDGSYDLHQFTDTDGNVTLYEYDERGNLLQRTDPVDGYSSTYYDDDITRWAYDSNNRVISTTNALGYSWLYAYDSNGNLTQLTAPNGSITAFTYTSFGLPATVTNALGQTTTYSYDANGYPTHVNDANGNVFTTTYDTVGRTISYTDANSNTVSFAYDFNNNLTSMIDPKGQPVAYEYDGNDLLARSIDRLGGEWLYQYDENLKLISEQDPEGNGQQYTYDAMYNLTSVTNALGHSVTYQHDDLYNVTSITDANGAVMQYEYDDNGRLTAIIDPLGNSSHFTYDAANRLKFMTDALGNQTEFCYNALDQLTRVFDPRRAMSRYEYDEVGNLLRVIDPLGNVTAYEYDAIGNLLRVTNAAGYQTDYEYDVLNRLTAVIQPTLPDGQRPTAQFGYDAIGNLISLTSPRGFSANLAYDANGNLTTATDALGGQTITAYDADDRPINITDANGSMITTTYNLVGLPVMVQDGMGYTTTLVYDAAYRLTSTINGMGQTSDYAYDPVGQLVQTTDPLGNETQYSYDLAGQTTAVTNANNQTTAYDYDPLGRLIQVTDPLTGTTAYEYDAVGNLAAITDANNNTTTFQYNFLNQLKQETNPLGNVWTYAYDELGHLTRRVDAMWRATYYAYDSNGRLTDAAYGISANMPPISYTYDLDGNQTMMCDGLGCTTHNYDALGRPIETTDWQGQTISRAYDLVGNLTGLTYPNGDAIQYGYNGNNWLTQFTDPHGDSSLYSHNALGQVTAITHPNNTVAAYSYDAAGRLTAIDQRQAGAAQPQSAYAYGMDAIGNRTSVVETRAAFDGTPTTVVLTHTYAYDGLNRLTNAATAAPDSDTAYTFDAAGNRLLKDGTVLTPDVNVPELPVAPRPETTAYTYNEANQLLTAANTSYEYNDNGERIRETEVLTDGTTLLTAYAYNTEGRLIGATKAISSAGAITTTMNAVYVYDGYGRRVQKEVAYPSSPISPTQTFTYTYNGLNMIGAQLAVDGVVTTTHYYLAPSPVTGLARPVEMERLANTATGFLGDRHWYQTDGLDSVTGLTDESGTLASPYLYDEYGQPLTSDSGLQRFAYTGQGYDPETGLTQFHSRSYDSKTGLWLSQDVYRGQVGIPSSLPRYVYVVNNPTTLIDGFGFAVYTPYNWTNLDHPSGLAHHYNKHVFGIGNPNGIDLPEFQHSQSAYAGTAAALLNVPIPHMNRTMTDCNGNYGQFQNGRYGTWAVYNKNTGYFAAGFEPTGKIKTFYRYKSPGPAWNMKAADIYCGCDGKPKPQPSLNYNYNLQPNPNYKKQEGMEIPVWHPVPNESGWAWESPEGAVMTEGIEGMVGAGTGTEIDIQVGVPFHDKEKENSWYENISAKDVLDGATTVGKWVSIGVMLYAVGDVPDLSMITG